MVLNISFVQVHSGFGIVLLYVCVSVCVCVCKLMYICFVCQHHWAFAWATQMKETMKESK